MSTMHNRLKEIANRQKPTTVNNEPTNVDTIQTAVCRNLESRHEVRLELLPAEMQLLGASGRSPIFLDTETTGLMGAGTLAFMIGVGKIENGILHVKQYHLTDYDQEENMLDQLTCDLKNSDLLVTYNGKSFDIPLLRSRFIMMRKSTKPLDLPHIDLLHGARRVYKKRLLCCSLIDIESQVLGIERIGDLPGKLAPEYWFTYLKTGEEHLLEEILRHNQQDIVTLAYLLQNLCQAYRHPHLLSHQQDIFSIGLAMEKMGQPERAMHCYQSTKGANALSAQARIFRRDGRYDEAAAALLQAVQNGGTVKDFIELAKIEEHKRHDFLAAIAWTDAALASCDDQNLQELQKRQERLLAKQRRIQS